MRGLRKKVPGKAYAISSIAVNSCVDDVHLSEAADVHPATLPNKEERVGERLVFSVKVSSDGG